MIITVDPSQSEDIAAFAMVKQYRLQALNVTLNGGTGVSAWQAVQGGEGYTQTVVTAVTGIELVYEDPNAIVSYTVENDDTSNYDVASNAGIILSSIVPTDNAWTYTCVFHADSVPVSSVDIDLLVYGNIARGTEQQGSPATAEEITAQVLAGLETRVTALEEEMPDKADVATTYTKTEIDNSVVKLTGNQDIAGSKTFSTGIIQTSPNLDLHDTSKGYTEGGQRTIIADKNKVWLTDSVVGQNGPTVFKYDRIRCDDGNGGVLSAGLRLIFNPSTFTFATFKGNVQDNVVTASVLDGYLPMVRTTGNQEIAGVKTFQNSIVNKMFYTNKADTAGVWIKVATASMPAGAQHNYTFVVQSAYYHSHPWAGTLYYGLWDNGGIGSFKYVGSSAIAGRFRIARKSDKTYDLWYLNPTGENYNGVRGIITEESVGSARSNVWHAVETADQTTKPSASGDWSEYASTVDVSLMGSDDYVRTSGNETIDGIKTFTGNLIVSSAGFTNLIVKTDRTTSNVGGLIFRSGTNTDVASIYSSVEGQVIVNLIGNVKAFSVPNQRAYNASNTNDVATIGTLDAYTPMVRTTGNQTISGKKIFASDETDFKGNWPHIRLISNNIDLTDLQSNFNDAGNYSVRDKNGVAFGTLRFVLYQNGTSLMQAVVRNSDGTYKYVNLATGDVIA